MTYSMFIGIKMLHRFLTFRSLISFFSVSLQASCCWDFQCTQSSISSPVSKNRKISSSFPQDWFFTMIHTPSWALHCIKKVFTVEQYCGLLSSLKSCYLLHTILSHLSSLFTGSHIVFLCGLACIFITSIWSVHAFGDEGSECRVLWIQPDNSRYLT